MSNEPRWLTNIDRKIGRLIGQHNDLIRDYRRALEHEHELEQENKQLRIELAAYKEAANEHQFETWHAGPPLSPLALPRNEKPRRTKKSEDQP